MSPQVFPAAGSPISGRVTPAAFPFFTTGEDNLRISSRNTQTGVVVQLAARLLDASGRPDATVWTHTPNTDGSEKTQDFPLSGLTILNINAVCSAGSPSYGQTFVKVQIIRGLGASAIVLGTVLAGPITAAADRGWPGSAIESAAPANAGYLRSIQATVPVGNNSWIETVPTGRRWELASAVFTGTPNPGQTNEQAHLDLRDASAKVIAKAITPQFATTTAVAFSIAFGEGMIAQTAGTFGVMCPLPQGPQIPSAGSFLMRLFGQDNASNYGTTSLFYLVREYLDI